MDFDVVSVNDMGEYYLVKYVTKHSKTYIEPSSLYVRVNNITSIKIQEELNKGNNILIPKNIETEVFVENLIIQEVDEVENLKNIILSRARNELSTQFMAFSGFIFFEMMTANNILNSHGYYITESNREEKYLEIITSGNEDVIIALEKYLSAYDKISLPYSLYKKIVDLEDMLSQSENIKDVMEAEYQYKLRV